MKPNPEQIQPNSVCILGFPWDQNSSFRRGPSLAPNRIRESYFSNSSNLWTEKGYNLAAIDQLYDMGNLEFHHITRSVQTLLEKDCHVICLGGDHSITFPVIEAYARTYASLEILHLEAHPDLYDSLDGNRSSHACPFARIMEKKLARRLVQAGIRTLNGHQKEQAQKWGVEIREMKSGPVTGSDFKFDGPVYLSLDLDCLDPAFAPGVSHHEPGGMTTREVIDIIHQFKGKLIGADIVEYNPDRDVNSMTAMVAAKLLKEIIARMYQDNT